MLFAKADLLMLEYLSILIVITPLLKCRLLYVGVLIFIGCSIHIPSKLSAAEQLLSSLLGRASVMSEVTCV